MDHRLLGMESEEVVGLFVVRFIDDVNVVHHT
jgi:hypothetical protein